MKTKKASEFIKHLQEMIEKYGDLDICAYGCNDQYAFSDPEVTVYNECDPAVSYFIIEPTRY